MVIDERESRHDYIVDAARQIMTAGRTAPKGKGIDNIEIVALTQNSILEVAGALRVSAEETGLKFFLRDADNIELAEAVILVGSRTSPMGLNCGYCGYATCIAKGGNADAPGRRKGPQDIGHVVRGRWKNYEKTGRILPESRFLLRLPLQPAVRRTKPGAGPLPKYPLRFPAFRNVPFSG